MANWKKYLSYIYPIIIHREVSEHGYHLEVTWENGRLVLNTDKANYSFGSLHRVFQKVFKAYPPKLNQGDEVAVLGFGVGSVAHILQNEMDISCNITGVEYDQKIIDLGTWFFDTKALKNVTIVCEDAWDFMEESNHKYKVIIVDLFNQLQVNELFMSHDFIRLLKSRLADDGRVYFNFVTNRMDRKKQFEELKKVADSIFSKSTVYKATGINKVLILENGVEL